MAIKSSIIGGVNGITEAQVFDGKSDEISKPRGLFVYQTAFETETNNQSFAVNDIHGSDMAVNGAISGATDGIHNGIDTALWTASGANFVFNSTTQAFTGTRSVDATSTVNNDQALFTRSTPVSLSTYSSITGAIYIDQWPTSGTKQVLIQLRLAGVVVSASVDIGNYINTSLSATWQRFVVPLTDLVVTSATVDEFTVTTVDIGAGQPMDYYLDDIALNAGSGLVYTVAPSNGNILRVYGISWTIVDNTTLALTNGTTVGLSYNKFGALSTLANGILVRRVQYNQTRFTNVVTNHSDIISGSNAKLEEAWDDGTNTFLKFYTKFAAPVDLSPKGGDRYEFVIQDDLSSLLRFQVRVDAATVTQPNGDSIS